MTTVFDGKVANIMLNFYHIHFPQGNHFKFIDDITEDPLSYVERISQEFVHLDNIFLQAAATIFNKDILLIPPDSQEPLVLWGGPKNTRGKGAPFLLGMLPAVDEIPCQYFSVVLSNPNEIPTWLQGYEMNTTFPGAQTVTDGEANDVIIKGDETVVAGDENIVSNTSITNAVLNEPCKNEHSVANSIQNTGEVEVVMRGTSARPWKRMDSYSGCLSRDLSQLIDEIQSGTDLNELYAKLDQCNDDDDEDEEEEDEDNAEDDYGQQNDKEEELMDQNQIEEAQEDSKEIEKPDEEYEYEEEYEEEEDGGNAEDQEEDKISEVESFADGVEIYKGENNSAANVVGRSGVLETIEMEEENGLSGDNSDNLENGETAVENDNRVNVEEVNVAMTKELNANADVEKEEDFEEDEWEYEQDEETANEDDEHENVNTHTQLFDVISSDKCDNIESLDETNGHYEVGQELESTEVTQLQETEKNLKPETSQTLQIRKRIRITATATPAPELPTLEDNASSQNLDTANSSEWDNHYCDKAAHEISSIQNEEISCDQFVTDKSKLSQVEITTTDQGQPIAVVSAPDGEQTEVQLRQTAPQQQQQRYRRKGSRASYRWSGQEMYQVDGPPACTDQCVENGIEMNNVHTENQKDSCWTSDQTVAAVSAAAEERLAAQQARFGLQARQPPATDSDSCFKALIDQMTLPGQDFPAWDRDDHTFLRWYICKQLEILASTGRGPDYILPGSNGDVNATLATFQGEDSFVGEALLFSFARLFKKDVVLLSGDEKVPIRYFKGGKGGEGYGRGLPFFLSCSALGQGTDKLVFTSLTVNDDTDKDWLVSQLRDLST
jgi:hypothetical protein